MQQEPLPDPDESAARRSVSSNRARVSNVKKAAIALEEKMSEGPAERRECLALYLRAVGKLYGQNSPQMVYAKLKYG